MTIFAIKINKNKRAMKSDLKMNLISLNNRYKECSDLSYRDSLCRSFAYQAMVGWAKKKGLYHSVEDPEGLTEITPGLKAQQNNWATAEYYYSVREDGRVHMMQHGQYEYLYGPADMGVVTSDDWFDLPLNFQGDIERVVYDLLGVQDPVYMNKELIDELKDFVSNFEY